MEADIFLSDYQSSLEKQLSENHRQQLNKSRDKGEEDGKRNLPAVDDDFTTPVEHEIRNRYQAEVESLYQNGQQVLNELREKSFDQLSVN